MNLRIVQLVSRGLAYALTVMLTKMGIEYSEGTITSITEPLATGTALLVTLVGDFYFHKLQQKYSKTK